MKQVVSKDYLHPHEVAALLRVEPVTVRAWAAKGILPSELTPGRHRRFLRQDVARFAAERGLRMEDGLTLDVTPRILVVDDERPIANYLAEFLNAHGAKTAVAYDGFDAGRRVEEFHPDFVVLDLMMPNLNGFDVCTRLKSDPQTKEIRVVAITGMYTTETRQRAIDAGASHCLPKPLDHDALLQIVGLPPVPIELS